MFARSLVVFCENLTTVNLRDKGKNDCIRKVTTCLRLVDLDYQFLSILISILLTPDGNLLNNMVIALMLQCFGNDLQLISQSFNNLITYIYHHVLRRSGKVAHNDIFLIVENETDH